MASRETRHRRDLRILEVLIENATTVSGWIASQSSKEMVFSDRKNSIKLAASAMGFTPGELAALEARLTKIKLP